MSELMKPLAKLKTVYIADIEVLSPLHIGTGKALQRGYDYTVFKNRTWRIAEDALFQEVYARSTGNQQAINRLLQARPAEELIEAADYQTHPEFFRYHMPGQPKAEAQGAELRECMKDSQDYPYVPGTSLKGALRTILAWGIVRTEKLAVDARDLKDNRSWAAQPLEQQIFGSDPNRDLLRALHVGDSSPADKTALMLANVNVVAGSSYQSPIEVEALQPGTHLALTLTLDERLLDDDVAQYLGWKRRGEHVRKVAVHARNWAGARIKTELAHYANRREMTRLVDFYQLLERLRGQLKGGNDFLVQMSWGGGWDAKTLGDQLSANPALMEQIINRYRLSMSRQRQSGDAFPRSRRIYFDRNGPAMPMGWVLVRMAERKP
jgi:CRISPR-associated protein Csm5